MNKIQHEKLTKYEQIFRTAIESNYYRSMDSRFAADFIAMCHELHIYIKPSCPACVLTALKTMGKIYFDYKEPEQRETPLADNLSNTEPKQPVEENPILDTQKPEDTETITKPVKVSLNKPKQSKKPITTRSKTNKK